MCSGQVTIMEIGLKDGHCNVCYKVVSAREHGLLCDLCDQWVHRRRSTGVSLNRYRDMSQDATRHRSSLGVSQMRCSTKRSAAMCNRCDDVVDKYCQRLCGHSTTTGKHADRHHTDCHTDVSKHILILRVVASRRRRRVVSNCKDHCCLLLGRIAVLRT